MSIVETQQLTKVYRSGLVRKTSVVALNNASITPHRLSNTPPLRHDAWIATALPARQGKETFGFGGIEGLA